MALLKTKTLACVECSALDLCPSLLVYLCGSFMFNTRLCLLVDGHESCVYVLLSGEDEKGRGERRKWTLTAGRLSRNEMRGKRRREGAGAVVKGGDREQHDCYALHSFLFMRSPVAVCVRLAFSLS